MCIPCVYHEEPLFLDITPSPNFISRLFPIFLDPKSFQTTLDYSSFYHMTSRSHAYLHPLQTNNYCCPISVLTLTLPKVCPHSRLITLSPSAFLILTPGICFKVKLNLDKYKAYLAYLQFNFFTFIKYFKFLQLTQILWQPLVKTIIDY